MPKQEFLKHERFLKLNDQEDFVIDYDGNLDIFDFHTHMSNVLPHKVIDPKTKDNKIKYKTLPDIERMDLSVPYWTKIDVDENKKGLDSIIKFSIEGYKILKDMANGGTYANCFKSLKENKIKRNVVLSLSTKKCDCSMEALKLVRDYPERFIAFVQYIPMTLNLRIK